LGIENPSPGTYNQLTVSYTINNGDTNTTTVDDNGVLMISAPPERKAVGLQIDKAEYGFKGNYVDVTGALRTMVNDGTIDVKVSPSTMGVPDPDPTKQKSLKVTYSLNGAKNVKEIKDGATFKISAPAAEKSTDTTSMSGHVGSGMWMLYRNFGYFVLMFLYVLSIYTAMDVGKSLGFQMPITASAVVLPLFSFWGMPFIFFFRRIFYTSDLVVTISI
jgi:hypothetical protein